MATLSEQPMAEPPGVEGKLMSNKTKYTGRALKVVAASGIVLGALAPAAAFAAPYPEPTVPTTAAAAGSQVAGATASRSTLPLTGGDLTGLALIGVGAALAGVVMVRHSRRNRVTA